MMSVTPSASTSESSLTAQPKFTFWASPRIVTSTPTGSANPPLAVALDAGTARSAAAAQAAAASCRRFALIVPPPIASSIQLALRGG
jgi:hypothetical protein